MNNFSIIWTENDTRRSFSDFSFIKDIGIDTLINLGSNVQTGKVKPLLSEYFTVNTDTILSRSEMFFELINNVDLYKKLDNIFSELTDIYCLKLEKEGKDSNEAPLFSINELEIYIDFIVKLKDFFENYTVKSAFLLGLKREAEKLYLSDDFEILQKEIKKQSHQIKYVKSVTIGINLDAQLHPVEAGVVKTNEDLFVSGNFIDKLLRMDFAKSEFICSAPLLPVQKSLSDHDLSILRSSINIALNKIFSASLKSWDKTVKKYSADGLGSLFGVMHEWRFITVCTDALLKIKCSGGALCIPSFSDNEKAEGLYHPILALHTDDVVLNDLEFTDKRIYILTGPNQGGKSIYMQAVGLLYSMLHLGLPLPAFSASIKPVDGIFTHFIDNSKQSYQSGRLETECRDICRILQFITKDNLFLFDEALSSTSTDDAEAISSEIIKAYSDIGAKGIWTTHLHHLCKLADEYEDGKSKIGKLSAKLIENTHKRIYRITPGTYGQSFALDIAKKYHLTKFEILEKRTIDS